MIDIVTREWIYFWYYFSIQFDQIVVYWAVGTVIGSVISVFGKDRISRMFQIVRRNERGASGLVPACCIGIASPLCMFGTIPISASFSQLGVKDDLLAAFMMGSILLNPQLIIYSAALGPAALTVRILSCFACGIAAGLCVRYFFREKAYFNFSGFESPVNRDTDPNPFLRLLKNIGRNVKITAPYFLIGISLSAMFQRYVPESVMVRIFGNNKAFGILMGATIGVPLYVCGGGTVPILQQWLAGGMSLGAAAAFMIAGPATKITNLSALKIVLGAKGFALYFLFSMTFAYLTGLLIDSPLIFLQAR